MLILILRTCPRRIYGQIKNVWRLILIRWKTSACGTNRPKCNDMLSCEIPGMQNSCRFLFPDIHVVLQLNDSLSLWGWKGCVPHICPRFQFRGMCWKRLVAWRHHPHLAIEIGMEMLCAFICPGMIPNMCALYELTVSLHFYPCCRQVDFTSFVRNMESSLGLH